MSIDLQKPALPAQWIRALLLFSVCFLPGFMTQSVNFDMNLFSSLRYHFGLWIVMIPQLLLIIYLAVPPVQFTSPKKQDILPAALLFLLLLGLGLLLSLFAPQTTPPSQGSIPAGLIPVVILTQIIVAYREEAFFRVFLLSGFSGKSGNSGSPGRKAAGALVLSTILFAAGHAQEGFQGIVTTGLQGLVLGIAYLRGNSFHRLAWAHAAYNCTAILLYFR